MNILAFVALLLMSINLVMSEDIVKVAKSAGLSKLLKFVMLAELAGPLTDGAVALTVLAPTNAAFEALPRKLAKALTKSYNQDLLQQVLLYHVFGSRIASPSFVALVGQNSPPTLQGGRIAVSKSGDDLILNGDAKVGPVDVAFDNGDKPSLVHVIDSVLMPPGLVIPKTITEIVAELAGGGEFTLLLKYLKAFGNEFTSLLSSYTENGLTVFAPTDAAFRKLPRRFKKFPLGRDCRKTIARILQYHVVPRAFKSTAFRDNSELNTLEGKRLDVDIQGGDIYIDDAKVIQADIRASNGVIHVIDEVNIYYK